MGRVELRGAKRRRIDTLAGEGDAATEPASSASAVAPLNPGSPVQHGPSPLSLLLVLPVDMVREILGASSFSADSRGGVSLAMLECTCTQMRALLTVNTRRETLTEEAARKAVQQTLHLQERENPSMTWKETLSLYAPGKWVSEPRRLPAMCVDSCLFLPLLLIAPNSQACALC
mgnify:CR=1 FL=1